MFNLGKNWRREIPRGQIHYIYPATAFNEKENKFK